MASGTPIFRQISWPALALQIGLFTGLILFFNYLALGSPTLMAFATYLVLVYALRFFFAKYHRYGMSFIKRNAFMEAIPFFEASYEYFQEKPWLDQYRALFLLNTSKVSYQEMALVNIAYCYYQAGNEAEAKATYEQTLKEFPESEIAKAGLHMLQADEKG